MKTICLIGLGTISKNYLEGITASDYFELKAVADVCSSALSRKIFNDYAFFNDYKKMIADIKPDYVLIATPPETHFEIASYALNNGVNVIVEKPAVLSLADFDRLKKTAEENGRIFEVMFHWQFGSEVLEFNRRFDKKKIEKIHVSVSDAYSDDGKSILPLKRKLKGALIDSGVNMISMLKTWLPFEDVKIINKQTVSCVECGLPIYVKVDLIIDGVPVTIEVEWRKGIDKKITYMDYDGKRLVLDNSEQKISYDGSVIDCSFMPRLKAHYYNYFSRYNGVPDTEGARRIHSLLFKVDEL